MSFFLGGGGHLQQRNLRTPRGRFVQCLLRCPFSWLPASHSARRTGTWFRWVYPPGLCTSGHCPCISVEKKTSDHIVCFFDTSLVAKAKEDIIPYAFLWGKTRFNCTFLWHFAGYAGNRRHCHSLCAFLWGKYWSLVSWHTLWDVHTL